MEEKKTKTTEDKKPASEVAEAPTAKGKKAKAEKPVAEKKGSVSSSYAKKKAKKKGKPIRKISRAKVYIKTSYNNTIVTITDLNGSVLAWATAGNAGFKGAKKSTPYAAGIVARNVAESVVPYGVKELDVYLRGVGMGREAAVRGLQTSGLEILSMKDITPIPHNGCRPRKARRV